MLFPELSYAVLNDAKYRFYFVSMSTDKSNKLLKEFS